MQFIKKVYLTLTLMIAFTCWFVIMCMFFPEINKFQYKYWPILIVLFVIIITIEIMVFCCHSISRSSPLNIILLCIFTLCFAYLIGFICYFFDPIAVVAAFLLTLAGFAGMTIYAFVTKTDLTVWWAVLFGVSLAFFVLGLVFFFIYN